MKVVLNETLKKMGKSQYWLSKETGIAASTLNNLCNGKTTAIQFSILDKICNVLNCDITDIIITDTSAQQRLLQYAYKLNNSETEGDTK